MNRPVYDLTADSANVVALLRQKGLQVATAESCTAGLVSAAITAVSGASDVFACGVAAYSLEIKHSVLGVPRDILDTHGAVSAETAAAMAHGVQTLSGADIGVAVTGVAGPSPSEGKAVGTVHIALADAERVWLHQMQPSDTPKSRDEIRAEAVGVALSMIQRYADAYPTMAAGSIPLEKPAFREVVIPQAPAKLQRRFLATVLPWKGDTIKERLVKIGVWLLIAAVLGLATVGIYQLAYESGNRSLYSNLQSMYAEEQDTTSAEQNGILSRFNSLYLQNADIGGWIRVDGTEINYPVMKNAGSEYYATHNFHQQNSSYGVPYFHEQNAIVSRNEQNKVLIVYGNNTGDGQMFSALPSYRDADFFREHITLNMSTLYASDKWIAFGVMVLDPEEINAFRFEQTSFDDDDAFLQYVDNIRKRSLLNVSIDVSADDDLLLLVTQAGKEFGFDNATLVVAAKRMRDGEVPPTPDEVDAKRNSTALMPRVWVRIHANRQTTAKRTVATTTATTAQTTVPTTQSVTTSATSAAEVTTTVTVATSTSAENDNTVSTTTADAEEQAVINE